MTEWFDDLIIEMIDAGLIEEIEPGVVQKLGSHGHKLDYKSMRTTVAGIPEAAKADFKIGLLALMEAPETMGTPVEDLPEDLQRRLR